ncbi:hypothetical protein ACF05T_06600 [Streptomyces lateritius]|uniref:Cytochrome C oxidase subunit I n=1 Tax=Streptomyces lateritius TaxID=67313 RepID=A0ABW6Y7I3_9ACTN
MDRDETAAGLARLEGYLMSQAVLSEARRAGEDFARALSWLGPLEREEIARRFADEHLALRRQMLHAVVERAAELRGEYSDRYDLLRRRTLALALTAMALFGTAAVLIAFLG